MPRKLCCKTHDRLLSHRNPFSLLLADLDLDFRIQLTACRRESLAAPNKALNSEATENRRAEVRTKKFPVPDNVWVGESLVTDLSVDSGPCTNLVNKLYQDAFFYLRLHPSVSE